ncbi:hypothetical protein [Marinobacter nauticus]|uniref:Uncharacterized protein n=1 Tax=Marinobacter nauticus TaxID=2743 RepID=A0A368UQZ1_MARNT|nr:hypothetical protein [Marinobacter nauticus]RBP69604.1 hypothetical protein DET64_11246 [Marinobacter nauticus]RCW31248.1 hypothetical protein DET51_11246 [Marinobacter nauticus]
MTDNVEELKAEVERLRAKNAQLLDEKKKVAGGAESLTAELEALTKERDEAKAELHRLTVELPRMNTLEEVAMPNMADTLLREISHHFDIGEGETLISKETGEPLQVEVPSGKSGKPETVAVKLDEIGIRRLYECKVIPAIGAMIKGSGASGGGAKGAGGVYSTTTPQPSQSQAGQTRRFGLS